MTNGNTIDLIKKVKEIKPQDKKKKKANGKEKTKRNGDFRLTPDNAS